MEAVFSSAAEAEAIGRELIQEFHTHLRAHGVRLIYLFRDDVPKLKGKEVWGKAQVKTGLDAYLARCSDDEEGQPFFVLTFSRPIWRRLSEKQRRALVDHELSHCWAEPDEKTGAIKLSTLPHDCEEFRDIIVRHGLWASDVERFAEAIQQCALPI